jgi:hypothetical protein
LILGILTAGNALTSPQNIFLLALVLFLFGMLGPLIKRLKKGFLVKEEIKSA